MGGLKVFKSFPEERSHSRTVLSADPVARKRLRESADMCLSDAEWTPASMVRIGSETWGEAGLDRTMSNMVAINGIRAKGLRVTHMTFTPGKS